MLTFRSQSVAASFKHLHPETKVAPPDGATKHTSHILDIKNLCASLKPVVDSFQHCEGRAWGLRPQG